MATCGSAGRHAGTTAAGHARCDLPASRSAGFAEDGSPNLLAPAKSNKTSQTDRARQEDRTDSAGVPQPDRPTTSRPDARRRLPRAFDPWLRPVSMSVAPSSTRAKPRHQLRGRCAWTRRRTGGWTHSLSCSPRFTSRCGCSTGRTMWSATRSESTPTPPSRTSLLGERETRRRCSRRSVNAA